MEPQLHLNTKRLFPFILFRSPAQLAFWLAILASAAMGTWVILHLLHQEGALRAAIIGGIAGSLIVWIGMLPYELRLAPAELRECLVKVAVYLARSNMTPVKQLPEPSAGEWIPNQRRLRWKGNEVEIAIEGTIVVVRGPRSMIKPLWRNFRGPWRQVLTRA